MKRLTKFANEMQGKKYICELCFHDISGQEDEIDYEDVLLSDYSDMPDYNEKEGTFMCERCGFPADVFEAKIINGNDNGWF